VKIVLDVNVSMTTAPNVVVKVTDLLCCILNKVGYCIHCKHKVCQYHFDLGPETFEDRSGQHYIACPFCDAPRSGWFVYEEEI